MTDNKFLHWETVDPYTQRLKVPGGWLVKVFEDVTHNTEWAGMSNGWDWRVAVTFLPDPNHEWGSEVKEMEKRMFRFCKSAFFSGAVITFLFCILFKQDLTPVVPIALWTLFNGLGAIITKPF